MRQPTLLTTLIVGLTALSAFASTALAGERRVDAWLEKDAARYVAKQLATMPRFRDNTVRFVVFDRGQPAPRPSRLALKLRDDLRDAVTKSGGVRIAWHPAGTNPVTRLPDSGRDCDAARADLLIGVELTDLGGRYLLAEIRALDVVEQTWIAGFARDWRGELTRPQLRLLRDAAIDTSFLGERGVPYSPDQTDLMARHLAQQLRCQLMAEVSGEYTVRAGDGGDDGTLPAGVLPLVRSQVGGVSSLRIVSEDGRANARFDARLHPVDRSLSQYWVTLTPTEAGADIQPLSASVYLRTPAATAGSVALPRSRPGNMASLSSPESGILGAVDVIGSRSSLVCNAGARPAPTGTYRSARADCAALRISARRDAVVFVLNHQLNRGLVRFDSRSCDRRPAPRIARSEQTILVALPGEQSGGHWAATDAWSDAPAGDTYYAVATSNSEAARALARHVARLPQRCGEPVRDGLRDAALIGWLEDFRQELDRWAPQTDWRAVSARRVY